MSPSSVVMVRFPPATAYLAGLSRTIAFQRDLSSDEPEKSSSRDGPAGAEGPSSRNQSKSATGALAAALLKANMPIRGFAGSAAERPTGVHVDPSVEYAPVMFVPSLTIRR